jgi:hypothetical protein
MSEFDDLDLGRRLRDAAGPDPDLATAQLTVGHRVVRARRRRVAVLTGAATALIVTVGVVATVGNDGEQRIRSASPPTDTVTLTTPDSSATSNDASSTTVVGTTTTDRRGPATTVPTPTTSLPTAPPVPPSAVSTTNLPGQLPTDSSTTSTTDSTATTSIEPAPTTTPPPADVTETFGSVGGTITVRLSGGQLQLLDATEAAGYTIERQVTKPDDVEVRFVSGDAESRIRVRIVGGQMNHEVDEH